jgi:gliding motility-associated protein GldM
MSNLNLTKTKLVRIIIMPVLAIVVCIYLYDANKISKERRRAIQSFAIVNLGLLNQKQHTEEVNMQLITAFTNEMTINPKDQKRKYLYQKSVQVGQLSKELNDWIENMKIDLVAITDGCEQAQAKERVSNPLTVVRKGNYKKPTKFFGTYNPGDTTGKAHELKMKLEKYRKNVLSLVDSRNKSRIEKNLALLDLKSPDGIESSGNTSWEMFYFYELPLSAALVELTRWQNIVCNAENELLTYFWDQLSATSFKFDAIMAVIIPKTTVVNAGSNFEADVMLASYSVNVKPQIIVGTSVDTITGEVVGGVALPSEKISNGRGHISIPTSGKGTRTCAGSVGIVNPVTGKLMNLAFSTKYTVK